MISVIASFRAIVSPKRIVVRMENNTRRPSLGHARLRPSNPSNLSRLILCSRTRRYVCMYLRMYVCIVLYACMCMSIRESPKCDISVTYSQSTIILSYVHEGVGNLPFQSTIYSARPFHFIRVCIQKVRDTSGHRLIESDESSSNNLASTSSLNDNVLDTYIWINTQTFHYQHSH